MASQDIEENITRNMFIRKRKHQIPGLNTTSTADISFMLLIFFLVSTSMDVDKGLRRQLPPAQPKTTQQESIVDKNKLLELSITADNIVMQNGHKIRIQDLQVKVEDFIMRLGKEHLITIKTAPESTYDTYFQLQHCLMAAYKEVRTKWAQQHFGHSFDDCSDSERQTVIEHCPQRIAETYQDLGGGMSR